MKANSVFFEKTAHTAILFAELLNQEPKPLASCGIFPNEPAIYAFFDGSKPVHVGRTRNLRQRLRGHQRNSRYTASFAFKTARRATGRQATYLRGEGRDALLKEPAFAKAFSDALLMIKGLSVRYLIVSDPIEQYLLELYAALELNTSLSEFETH